MVFDHVSICLLQVSIIINFLSLSGSKPAGLYAESFFPAVLFFFLKYE